MNKAYGRINWENYPSDATPLNEQNLNRMDVSVDEIDNRVITLDTTKFDKTEAAKLIKSITFDRVTGIFTITYYNGATATIDTMLEKLAVNFSYDASAQQLIIILDDGTIQNVDLSALITQYEFLNTDTVAFSIDSTGKVSALVKDGSITEDKLQPNYLADIKVEVSKAELSVTSAEASEKNASNYSNLAKSYAIGTNGEVRENDATDNAKYYYEQSKEMVDTVIDNCERPRGIFTGNVDELRNMNAVGSYWVHATAATGTHPVSDSYYLLEVTASTDGIIVQRANMFDDCKIYERMYVNAKWYDWNKVGDAAGDLQNQIDANRMVTVRTNELDANSYGNFGLHSNDTTLVPQDVAYGNEKFVAVSTVDGAQVFYSSDGLSWSPGNLDDDIRLYSVAYGNGRFVAVGSKNDGTGQSVWYSDNAIDWVETTISDIPIGNSNRFRSIRYGGGRFVAGGIKYICNSADGINWTTTDLTSMGVGGIYDIAYGNGKFVVGTGSTYVYYSTDAVTWTRVSVNVINQIYDVTYGNGKFVARGASNGSGRMVYSTDGITWTKAEYSSGEIPSCILYNDGIFFMGNQNGMIYKSYDGINWSPVTMLGPAYNKMACDGKILVMVGTGIKNGGGYMYFEKESTDIENAINDLYKEAREMKRQIVSLSQSMNNMGTTISLHTTQISDIYSILGDAGLTLEEDTDFKA